MKEILMTDVFSLVGKIHFPFRVSCLHVVNSIEHNITHILNNTKFEWMGGPSKCYPY